MAGLVRKITRVKKEPPVAEVHPLVAAIGKYRECHKDLLEYMDKHAAVFEGFFARTQVYNTSLDNVRALMQTTVTLPDKLDKDFRRGAKGRCTTTYVAALLPPEIAAMPGVVTREPVVSKEVLGKLIKQKVITEEQISAARKDVYGSPPVYMPSNLKINFAAAGDDE
jgi:hypothetical protein